MRLPSLLCALSLAAFTGYAADAPKSIAPKAPAPKNVEPPVYMTVETAGPDFPLQGEYAGEGLGANIIALGDGNFRLVTFKGGLPGAGWDASAKNEVEAKRDGDVVRFKEVAELKGGVLTVGATSLKRIERHSPTEGAKPMAAMRMHGKAATWMNVNSSLPARRPSRPSRASRYTWNSSCLSSPLAVAKAARTAASMCRTAMKYRSSIASA